LAADKNRLLVSAFKELEAKGFSFSLWSPRKLSREEFGRKNWPAKNIFLGPDLKANHSILLFTGWDSNNPSWLIIKA